MVYVFQMFFSWDRRSQGTFPAVYGNEFIIRHNAKLKPCLPRDNVILKLVDDDIPC